MLAVVWITRLKHLVGYLEMAKFADTHALFGMRVTYYARALQFVRLRDNHSVISLANCDDGRRDEAL